MFGGLIERMNKKIVGCFVIMILLFSALVTVNVSSSNGPWWDKKWSYCKELSIPIDTGDEHAHYQPVDIPVVFDDPCWALDSLNHSVRVVTLCGGRYLELESQIYDLQFCDKNHISNCNLVFLIPAEANGNERYFIYYDDESKENPGYIDHVSIDDTYFRFEPVYGQFFESWIYKIDQEELPVYIIAQEGETPDCTVSQQVTKIKPDSENVMPNNGEHVASFAFKYWWKSDDEWSYITSSDKLISKKVFVDGNLMVKCAVVSGSNNDQLKSTVFYKYYFCPLEHKRIYTHVKHEILDHPLPVGTTIDTAYCAINSGDLRSAIEDLNFGSIPPFLHLYNDEGRVVTYDVDTNPEGVKWQRIISDKDDCDLGCLPWVSLDYGRNGNAQAVILESTDLIKPELNEQNGIQIQLLEGHTIQLPGIDGMLANVYMMRNRDKPDDEIPKDFVAEFNAEFFSTEHGGYPLVDKEAQLYQTLINYQPLNNDVIEDGNNNNEEYSLTTYVLLPPYLLMKLVSARLFLKYSYISVELSQNNEVLAVGRAGRIPITKDFGIDWGNISLIRKVKFNHLKPGIYTVKVSLRNPLIGYPSRYIGCEVIELKNNIATSIYCNPEGEFEIFVKNQYGAGLENAELCFLKDDAVITKRKSNQEGKALILAPCGISESYLFRATYKGFLLEEEEVYLGRLTEFFPLEKNLETRTFNFTVNLRDYTGRTPGFNVDITLTSSEMYETMGIQPDLITQGQYFFNELIPANYTLKIKYKNFEIKEQINIQKPEIMDVDLYDLKLCLFDKWDLPPEATLDVYIESDDFEKSMIMYGEPFSDNGYLFPDLYPGVYTIKIGYKNHLTERTIAIPHATGNITMVFPASFNVTLKIYDNHGNTLENARVIISRNNDKKQRAEGYTDPNGKIIFNIPPGEYDTKIYYDNSLIAERKINVLTEKTSTMATNKEPIITMLITVLALIALIGFVINCYRKKQKIMFLKIFAITLAVIALVLPWWSINSIDNTENVRTSTNMYIVPTEMITITSKTDILVGELEQLDKEFSTPVGYIPIAQITSVMLVVFSLFLTRFRRNILSVLAMIIAVVLFIVSTIGFYIAMSGFSKIIVRSLIGEGNIDISIPSESITTSLHCSWGLNLGFYLTLLAVVILLIIAGVYFCRKIIRKNG